MLRYIRRGKPWAIVLCAHHEANVGVQRNFRSLEVTVYPRRDGRIGRRHERRHGRFWITWILSPGMSEVHAGFDNRRKVR